MSTHDPQVQHKPLTMSNAIMLLWLGCHVWALPHELLWRRYFGSRYIDGWLLAAAIWPMFFCVFLAPEFGIGWAWVACWLILFFGVYHGIVARGLDRRGIVRHSQYNGFPILCRIFPLDEETCKMRWELLLTALVSLPAVIISPSLTAFLWGSCLATIVKGVITETYQQNLMTDMRDARLEQQSLARRMQDEL